MCDNYEIYSEWETTSPNSQRNAQKNKFRSRRERKQVASNECKLEKLENANDWKNRERARKEAQKSKRRQFNRDKEDDDYHRLHNVVFEYGSEVNFKDPASVEAYLTHYASWISNLNKITDYGGFIQFSVAHLAGKSHRQVALTLLMKQIPYAKAMNLAFYGKLSEKRFATLVLAADSQSWDFAIACMSAVALAFIYVLHISVGRLTTTAGSAVQLLSNSAANCVDTVTTSIDEIKSDLRTVTRPAVDTMNSFNGISDMIKSVWRWCKDKYDQLVEVYANLSPTTKAIAIALMKVIAVFLAVSYAMTFFADYVSQIKSYIMMQFGFYEEAEAQAEGDEEEDNVLWRVLDFFRQHTTNVPSTKFWMVMDKIPKIVSIAKAIEWIMDNMTSIYNTLYELVTGKMVGRNKVERDILAFDKDVTELDLIFHTRGVAHKDAATVPVRLTTLKLNESVLVADMHKGKGVRAFFSNAMARAREALKKLDTDYVIGQKAAKKRAMPVWLYMYGEPGTGKSYCTETIFENVWYYVQSRIGKEGFLGGEEYSNKQLYVWPQTESYFDGYVEQPFVLIDDLFQALDNETRANVASTLITMVAPTPFSMMVADPKQKAHTHFTSRLIISSTNMEEHEGPRPMDAENLGITDTLALSTRRTVILEVVKGEDDQPRFYCDNVIDGRTKTRLRMEQIIALVGDLIIARHNEAHLPVVRYDPQPFVGKFEGGRIVYENRGQAQSSNEPVLLFTDKGKNKVGDEESERREYEQVLLNRINGRPEEREELVTELLTEMVDELIDHQPQILAQCKPPVDEGEPEMPPLVTRKPRAVRPLDDQYQSPLDSHTPDEKKWSKQKFCDLTGEVFKREFCGIKFVRDVPADQEHRIRFLHHKFHADKHITVHTEHYLDSLLRYGGIPPTNVQGTIQRTLVSDEKWLRFWRNSPSDLVEKIKENPGQYLRATLSNPTVDVIQMMWLPTHMYVEAVNINNAPQIDYDFWRNNLMPQYEQILNHWRRKGALWLENQYLMACQRPSCFNDFLQLLGSFAIGFITTKLLLKMFMPAAAYGDAQSYDAVHKAPSKVHAKRAAKRQNARNRQIQRPAEAQATSHASLIMANIEHVTIMTNDLDKNVNDTMDVSGRAHALFVGGTTALISGHLINRDFRGKNVYVCLGENGRNAKAKFKIEELIIKEHNSDLLSVTFPRVRMNEKRNITGHFVDEIPAYGDCALYTFDEHGVGLIIRASAWDNVIMGAVTPEGDGFDCDLVFQNIPNEKGMCGLPYIHMSSGKIIGIHSAGRQTERVGMAIAVTRKELNIQSTLIDPLPLDLEIAPNIPGITVLGKGEAQAASFIPSHSNLQLTPLVNEAPFPFPETDDEPAPLHPIKLDSGEEIRPLSVALSVFGRQEDIPSVRKVFDHSEFIPKSFNRSKIRRLTLTEAVYGIPGELDAIDMSASVGFFYKKIPGMKTRREIFYEGEKKRVHPVFARDIEKRIEELERGIVRPAVYEETLKDEIRPRSKTRAGKTRLFAAGDLASFVISRMVLMTSYMELTKEPTQSPCGLGLNPHSDSWGHLHARLRRNRRARPAAGDMGNYDASLKNDANEDFILMMESINDDPFVRLVIRAGNEGLHVLMRLYFLKPWGTNSGEFLTSLKNTFQLFRCFKIIFDELYPGGNFRDIAKTFTGDDSVMSVDEDLYPLFTMTYIAQAFWTKWRMIYTAPDKTTVKAFLEWDDVEYLKRKFVPGQAGIMAPLAPASIANMIKWTEKYWDESKAESCMRALLLEAWHYGRPTYDDCLEWSNAQSRRLGYGIVLPSWEAMWSAREPDYVLSEVTAV